MTRVKLGAGMLAFALIAACGGGSNNADNSSANNTPNNANNESNTPNNENNTGSAFAWSATVTGLEDTDYAPPAAGLGGDGVNKAAASLLGDSADVVPKQTITIQADSADVYDEVGESVVSVRLSWGDPLIECASNRADTLMNTGGTIEITKVGPASGTFSADLECYLASAPTENIEEAQVTGEFDIVGL